MSDITKIEEQLDDDGELLITTDDGIFSVNEHYMDIFDLAMMAAVFGLELHPIHGEN